MKENDLVVRKSYNKDIVFKIVEINTENNKKVAVLKGLAFRIVADAYLEDLEKVTSLNLERYLMEGNVEDLIYKSLKRAKEREKKYYGRNNAPKAQSNSNIYGKPGRVLHLDGDKEYLKICLDVYAKLGIPAIGKAISESTQHKEIRLLLEEYNPDIVIITGHDAVINSKGNMNDIKNYKNTTSFIKAIKEARKYEPNLDNLVIFAGACQSHYEELIRAGANFASSPSRVMIHALDPVFVAEKIACSRIDKIVPLEEIFEHTVTGTKGVGGLETRGKYRLAMPKTIYS